MLLSGVIALATFVVLLGFFAAWIRHARRVEKRLGKLEKELSRLRDRSP